MAITKKTYSDNGRTALLSKTVLSAQADKEKGIPFLSDELVVSIITFLPEWKEKVTALDQFLGKREKEIREKNVSVSFLDSVIRDIWEVVKRRIRRKNEPAEVLTYYQLPLSGIIPNVGREKDLTILASKMIEGDAKAVEAGYEAMVNPSAEELNEALISAEKEISDVAPADRDYDMAQEEVGKLRGRANELVEDVISELQFALRKKEPASRRRVMLRYGVEFSYYRNESQDGDIEVDTVSDQEM